MDFGIAKAAERSTKTQAGMVKGKVAYMSPEQARGKPLDPRSDLFALATVLWEMLTNKRLFLRASDFETLTAILKEEAEPASKHRRGIDQELDDIISTALEKDRDHRQANVEAFARELTRWYYKNVSDPESESIRSFMGNLYRTKIAELPPSPGKPGIEPPTARPEPPTEEAATEPARPGRRSTGRIQAALARSSSDTGRPSRSSNPQPEDFSDAATILEDGGPTQAQVARALAERKKVVDEAQSASSKGGSGRLILILAAVAVVVGGVLAIVLSQ
jgi:serine/threonine protein kinase